MLLNKFTYYSLKLAVLFLFSSLLSCSAGNQEIDLPLVETAKQGDNKKRYIPIQVQYDANKELLLNLDGKITKDINDIEPYLLEKLKATSALKFYKTNIRIIADKALSLYDFEGIQEELKRLSMQRVFYVTQANHSERWSTGIPYQLPQRDEERISNFYKQRNLPFKKTNNLQVKSYAEDNYGRENIPSPAPPPPPFPTKFDEEHLSEISPNLNTAFIFIKSGNSFLIDGEQMSIQELKEQLAKKLIGKPCIFVLRKDAQASYGNYIQFLGILFNVYAEKRDDEAMKKFGKGYELLVAAAKREIREIVPYIVIEESIYMQ